MLADTVKLTEMYHVYVIAQSAFQLKEGCQIKQIMNNISLSIYLKKVIQCSQLSSVYYFPLNVTKAIGYFFYGVTQYCKALLLIVAMCVCVFVHT